MDLVFLIAAVLLFAFAVHSGIAARQNQDPTKPPSVISIGKHGLTPEGRAHVGRFWRALGLAVIALILALIFNVTG